jgi:hypothetical protein
MCIWQIFTLASCKCNYKNIYKPYNKIRVSVNKSFTLDSHAVYTAIDTYMHNTCLDHCSASIRAGLKIDKGFNLEWQLRIFGTLRLSR